MKNTLADRLAYLLSSLGIKQLDFAKRIRFAQSYVSMVLNGTTTSAGPRFIEAICREFNVNPEWLTGGKEPVFTIPDVSLSSRKAAILTKIQLLSAEKQKVVEDIIDGFIWKEQSYEDEKKPRKIKSENRKK
ncbi:MAG: helix-turn-helix domain-containing protein [Treponema sp.]|nr:helix-turn-helix domain-containing protein [Treponema sp.]